jgi:hypothetical protein
MISKEEKDIIETLIDDFAFEYSNNNSRRVSVDTLLKPWEDAKSEYLLHMFNNQLILSKPISYQKSIETMAQEISAMMDRKEEGYEFYVNYTRFRKNFPIELAYFMRPSILASNIYNFDSFSIQTPEGKELKINKGCKVIKALGKIAAAFNIPGFEKFRLAHSRILNQKQLTGNLCLSIHPLDYLTMSMNDCGWSSCMNWSTYGEYRRGTVEMMNSPNVIVAYLTSDKPYEIYPNTYWNNKKWRELFICAPEVICGIKGYPYCNESIEKIAADWIKELATIFTYSPEYAPLLPGHRVIFPSGNPGTLNFTTDAMYNDFGTCEHYAYISPNISDYNSINYSGPSECMCCGELYNSFYCESALVCNNCEEIMVCEECGERIDTSDAFYVDGSYYCSECVDEVAIQCALTLEYHFPSNCATLYLSPDRRKFNDYIWVTSSLVNSTSSVWTTYFTTDATQINFHEYAIAAEDCTLEGLRLFGFSSLTDYERYVTYEKAN